MAYNTRVYRVAALLRSRQKEIKEFIGSEYLGCKVDFYNVGSLQELKRVFLDIRDSYDGILTNGVFSDRFIACNNTDNAVAHRYISATEKNYFRRILLLTMEYPGLDLSRVRLDLMTTEHDLPRMIQEDILRKKMNEEHAEVYRLNEAGVISFEQNMASRQIRAMQSGEYDVFLTRSAVVMDQKEKLELKTKVIHVDYDEDEIYSAMKSLRQEIEKRDLQKSQVACIRFQLPEDSQPEQLQKLDHCIQELVHSQRKLSMMVQPIPDENGIEAITDAGTLDMITNERTYCEFWNYLNKEKKIPVGLGFGIGNTVKEAIDHAAQAVDFLKMEGKNRKVVYLFDSDGEIFTMSTMEREERDTRNIPVVQPAIMTVTVNRIAGSAHLSSRNVFRLMTALQQAHCSEATAEWLCQELELSPRMSNKMLSNLEKAGYASISGKTQGIGKGRPCNIYRFDFQ